MRPGLLRQLSPVSVEHAASVLPSTRVLGSRVWGLGL